MGRNSGGAGGGGINALRATARRSGLVVIRLTERQSSGGKYKYAIRGPRDNMRARSQSEARRLIRSRGREQKRFDAQLKREQERARVAIAARRR